MPHGTHHVDGVENARPQCSPRFPLSNTWRRFRPAPSREQRYPVVAVRSELTITTLIGKPHIGILAHLERRSRLRYSDVPHPISCSAVRRLSHHPVDAGGSSQAEFAL